MVLAKVYLNAQVYTGTADWANALAACNKVAAGNFALHPATANPASALGNSYYDLFGDVCPNDETILAEYITENVISGNIYTIRSLKQVQMVQRLLLLTAGMVPSFPARFLADKYDPSDIRRKQFFVGPQLGGITYTETVSSLISPGAAPNEGIRDVKFFPVAPADASGESNDFPIYRYADVCLMRGRV